MSLLIYLVAGEASGDILGARLMAAIKKREPETRFVGIGGPLMIAEGLDLYYPMARLAVMGIVPILKRLPELLKVRRELAAEIIAARADCLIGIDAPVFNTDLEKRVLAAGVKTVHYVSPSVWAWRENRIHKIKQSVSLMLCLFPFELAIYQKHDIRAICVGHALADEIAMAPEMEPARQALELTGSPVCAVLPGSRGSELYYLLPIFLQTLARLAVQFETIQFVLPVANAKYTQLIEQAVQKHAPDCSLKIIQGQSRTAMQAADVVLLASGTATLEAALLKKPMLVAYKMSAFSMWIYRRFLKIKQFSLPNLLAGKPLVKELMQEDCTVENILPELVNLLSANDDNSDLDDYRQIHQQLKLNGSEIAANAILKLLQQD